MNQIKLNPKQELKIRLLGDLEVKLYNARADYQKVELECNKMLDKAYLEYKIIEDRLAMELQQQLKEAAYYFYKNKTYNGFMDEKAS